MNISPATTEVDDDHREPLAHTTHTTTAADDEVRQAVQALDTTNVQRLSEFKRFVILTAASFAMICSSTNYSFNLFSGSLQKMYDFDSRAISTINTVGMVFAYTMLPYGTLYDYVGPFPIVIISCTYFSLGALMMGLTFQGVVEGSTARFSVYNALLSCGSQLFDLASVVTVTSIFPTCRGWVIAILKTLMGLGSALIGAIQIGFFKDAPANYFYFLIGFVVVVSTVVLPMIRLPAYHLTYWQKRYLSKEQKEARLATRTAYLTQEPPMWRFYLGVGVLLTLVVYLPLTSALIAFLNLSAAARQAVAAVACVLTLCLLLMVVPIPFLDRLTTKKPKHELSDGESCDGEGKGGEGHRTVKTDIDYIAPQYQTTFLQSCCTAKFWCIFWTMFCGFGAEFVIIFNARFIYAALDGAPVDDTVGTLLTVLNGAGSALGRLAMSAFEGWSQRRPAEERIPITVAFFVSTSCILTSITLFLVLPGRSLLVAYSVAALGNGFAGSSTILMMRTLYAKDPAKHYNFGINALVPAAILINRLLYGEWYAVQAEKQNSKLCYGKQCVLMPMLVMLGLNLTALVSNAYLHFSYRNFCQKVLAERRRLQEEGSDAAEATGEPFTTAVKEIRDSADVSGGLCSSDSPSSTSKAR